MFNLKERVEKTRQYVKDNAPALITAASTLGVYMLLRDERRAREADIAMTREGIDWAIDNNRAFSHFPGVGVRIWPDYHHAEHVPMDSPEPVRPLMDQYFGGPR